jgi:murein DD-endopeptidase MepM/ murein hydrolase activator NlpD
MNMKKKLTLMLIPGSNESMKQVRLPVYIIYGSIAAIILLVFGSFYFSAQFFTDKVSEKELESLRAENQVLSEKFEQLRWHLAEVEDRYENLVQKEIQIRSLFDLPEINTEERQLGTGGPSIEVPQSLSDNHQNALETESEVDRLLLLSKYELEQYAEVEASLNDVKDRLNHTPSIWPTSGWISRGYGKKYDPFTGMKQMHRGIDIANHTGTPIIATADGKVTSVGRNGGLGKMIVINHGHGFQTRYGHLSDYNVKRGQKVKRGDVIGYMGSTGYSTGPHLHYEVYRNNKSLNPSNYILNDKSL